MISPERLQMTLVFVSLGCGVTMEGYIFGHTAPMVAGLYAEKEALKFTDDDVSWIASIIFTSMIIGTALATFITERFGRRITISLFNVPIVIHWIVLYYVRDKYVFLFIRFMVGLCFGGAVPIIFMAAAEYSSPKTRSIFLTAITSLGPTIGGAAGEFISLATHWRTGALAAIVPAFLSALMPLWCIESPQWLASRGRFEECKRAFRALHGTGPTAEKELQLLLEVEIKKNNNSKTKTTSTLLLLLRLKEAMAKKYFWRIMVLSLVIQIYKTISGRILNAVLGVTMLQYMTGSTNVLMASMISVALGFLGCGISPFISKKLNVRTMLLAGGILTNVLLVTSSIVLYISSVTGVIYSWCNIVLYALSGCVVSASLFPILEMLPTELYPLEIKSACVSIIGIVISLFMFVYVKIIPDLFAQIDYYGVFLLHAVVMSVCLVYLWMKLPETKCRTLQEIELFFKTGTYMNIDEILTDTESNNNKLLQCEQEYDLNK